MCHCWQFDPKLRPSFAEMKEILQDYINDFLNIEDEEHQHQQQLVNLY